MEAENESLYRIEELIAWLENPAQHWTGKRPLLYAEGARKQLKRLHRTIVGVGLLAFFVGIATGWFIFVKL